MPEAKRNQFSDLPPIEIAELWRELLETLKIYLHHVVGIAGVYEHVGEKDAQIPQKPFYYSATVIEYEGRWYLLTAGHNLIKMDLAAVQSDMKFVACGLDDSNSPEAKNKGLIPFDYPSSLRICKDEDGLDYGLIYLSPHYQSLLMANGIRAFTVRNWSKKDIDECEVFMMYGFPEDEMKKFLKVNKDFYRTSVEAKPCTVLLKRKLDYADDKRFSRFIGEINNVLESGDITGMSGGPIIGVKGNDFDPYYVAAIQSSWLPGQQITFGCPIELIIEDALAFFKNIAKGE